MTKAHHKLGFLNIAPAQTRAVHGHSAKDMAVLHETVSGDIKGLADILGVEKYLASVGYGIHGMTDKEGHCAWAFGLGTAVFWQAGGVNERSIGIEQVSYIPGDLAAKRITMAQAKKEWNEREAQLEATAKLLACWHNVSPKQHPLVTSDGTHPGVTTHWNVSQHFASSEGHTDCHPVNNGGYYPLSHVISLAKKFAAEGYTF